MHPYMEVIPFIDKNISQDYGLFVQILSSVHFLLLPTRADCTPLVNCEANAYGVPAITTNVGGISEAVKDGINGYCLPIEAGGAEYALLINSLFSNKEKYHQLIESSRRRFDEELNWDTFAAFFQEALQRHRL
jgi:glycosyltransferase involved in cell wall biosynthesis